MTSKDKVFFKESHSVLHQGNRRQKHRLLVEVIAQDQASVACKAATDTALPASRGTHASAIVAVSLRTMVVGTKKGPSHVGNTEVIDLRGFSDGDEASTQMKVAGQKTGVETKDGSRRHLGRKSKERDMGAAQSGQKKPKNETSAEKASSKTIGTPSVKKTIEGGGSSFQKKGSKKDDEGLKQGFEGPRKDRNSNKVEAEKPGKEGEPQKQGPSKKAPEKGAKSKAEGGKRAEGKTKKDDEGRTGGIRERGLAGEKEKPAKKPPTSAGSAEEKAAGKSVADGKTGLKRKGDRAIEGDDKTAKRHKRDDKEQGAADGKTKETSEEVVANKESVSDGQATKAQKPPGKDSKTAVSAGPKKGGVKALSEAAKTLGGAKGGETKKPSEHEQKRATQLHSDSDSGRKSSEATESDEEVRERVRAETKVMERERVPSRNVSEMTCGSGDRGGETLGKSAAGAQPMDVDGTEEPSLAAGMEAPGVDKTPVQESFAAMKAIGLPEGAKGLEGGAENRAGEGVDGGTGGSGSAPETEAVVVSTGRQSESGTNEGRSAGSAQIDTAMVPVDVAAKDKDDGVKSDMGGAVLAEPESGGMDHGVEKGAKEAGPLSDGDESAAKVGDGTAGLRKEKEGGSMGQKKGADEVVNGSRLNEGGSEPGAEDRGNGSALEKRGFGTQSDEQMETEDRAAAPGGGADEDVGAADGGGAADATSSGDEKEHATESSGDEKENAAESSGDEKAHGTPMNDEIEKDSGERKAKEPVPEKMATRGLGKRERVPVRRILEEEELPQRASRLGSAKQADKKSKGGYRCDICGAVFGNGQALGGHKGSHKPSDAFTEDEKRSNGKKGTRAPFQKGQKSPPPPEVEKERSVEKIAPPPPRWSCEVCGLVFPSGQALGGHKGLHKSTHYTTLEKPSPRPSTFRSTRLQRRSEEKSAEKDVDNDTRADGEEDSSDGEDKPRTRGEGAFVKKLPMSLRPKDRLQSLAAIVSKKSRRMATVDGEDREKSSKRIAERLRRTADGARKRTETSGALSPTGQKGMDSFEEDAVAGLMVLRQPITLSVQREPRPERQHRKRANVDSVLPGRKSDDSSTLAAAQVLVGKNGLLDAAAKDSDEEMFDSDAELTASDEYEDADAAFSSGAEKSGREERRSSRRAGTVPGESRQSSEPAKSGEERPRRPETRTKEERRATRKLRGSSDEEEVWRPRSRDRGVEPRRTQGEKKENKQRPRGRTGLLSGLGTLEGIMQSQESIENTSLEEFSALSYFGMPEGLNAAALAKMSLEELLPILTLPSSAQKLAAVEEARKKPTEATGAKDAFPGMGKRGAREGKGTGEAGHSDRDSDEPLAGAFNSERRFGENAASLAVSPTLVPREDASSPTPYIIPIMEEAEATAGPREPSDDERELLPLSALKTEKKKKKKKVTPTIEAGTRVPVMQMWSLIMERNREQIAKRDKAERAEKARAKRPPSGTPAFKVPGQVATKPGPVSKKPASKGLEGEKSSEAKKRKVGEDVNGAEKGKKQPFGGGKEGAESRNGTPSNGDTTLLSNRPPPSLLLHEGGESRPFVPEINARMVLDFLKGVQTSSKGPAEREAQLAGGERALGRIESDSGDEDAPIGLLSKFRSPEKRVGEMRPPEQRAPEKRPVDKSTALGGASLTAPVEDPKKRKRAKKSDGGATGRSDGGVLPLPTTGGSNASDPGCLSEQNSASEADEVPIGRMRVPDSEAQATGLAPGYTELNRRGNNPWLNPPSGGVKLADRPFKEGNLEEEIKKAVEESVMLIQHYKMARKMCLKMTRDARKKRRKEQVEAGVPEEELSEERVPASKKGTRERDRELFKDLAEFSPAQKQSHPTNFPLENAPRRSQPSNFPLPREPNPVQLGAPPENRPRHVSSSVNDFLERLGLQDFVDKAWPSNARPSPETAGRPSDTPPQPSDGLRFPLDARGGRRPGESERPLADFVGIPPVRPSYTVLTEEEELEHGRRPKLSRDELSNAYLALKSAVESGRPRQDRQERERFDLNTGLSLGGTPQAASPNPAPFLQMLREGGARPPGTPPSEFGRGPELGAFCRDKGVVKNGKWLPMGHQVERGEATGREHRGLELPMNRGDGTGREHRGLELPGGRGDETGLTVLWSRPETRGQSDLPLVKTGLEQFLGRGLEERPGGAPKAAGVARPSSLDPARDRPLPNKTLDLNLGGSLPARTAPPATRPSTPLIAPVWKSISDRELLSRDWELPNWIPANLDGTRDTPPSKRPYAPPRFNPRDQTGVSGPPLFNGPQPNLWKDKDGPPNQTGVSNHSLFNGPQPNVYRENDGNRPGGSNRAWPELLKERQEGLYTRGDAEPAAVLNGRDVHRRASPGFLELRSSSEAVRDGPLFSEQEILETRARRLGLGGTPTGPQVPGSKQVFDNTHLFKSAETLRRLLGKNESLTSPAIRSYAEGVNKMVQEGSKLLPDPKPLAIPNLDEPVHTTSRSLTGAPAGFPIRSMAPAPHPEQVTEDGANWAKVTTSNLPGWLASEVEKRRKGE